MSLQVAKGFGLIVSMDGCDAVSCGEKTEFFLGCYVQNVGDFQDVCFARWLKNDLLGRNTLLY